MARGWMRLGWLGMALAAWLGLVGPAAAQVVPAAAPPPKPEAAPAGPPPGPPAAMGGAFMGLPCPPPVPAVACPPPPPPCEGPTDNTQFNLPMFHVGFDYLYWYPRKSSLPPLITSGNTAMANPAVLSDPRTRVLLKGTQLEDDQLQGGRITFGVGVDQSDEWSLVATAFLLEQGSRSFSVGDRGRTGVLARPFFDTSTGMENADVFAVAGDTMGALTVTQRRRIYGGDVDLGYEYLCTENHRFHLLAGVKLLFLDESLDFNRMSVNPDLLVTQSESLAATNRFYGGQVGAQWEFRLGPVFFLARGKVAFGVTDVNPSLSATTRTLDSDGFLQVLPNQGLYVSAATAGRSHKTVFAVAPEANLRFGFDFNDWVRLSVGYTFIGLTDATRAGDLINRNVNPTTLAQPLALTTVAPQATTPTTGFWVQGFDVSVRFSF